MRKKRTWENEDPKNEKSKKKNQTKKKPEKELKMGENFDPT
jgi:hypothetical protein